MSSSSSSTQISNPDLSDKLAALKQGRDFNFYTDRAVFDNFPADIQEQHSALKASIREVAYALPARDENEMPPLLYAHVLRALYISEFSFAVRNNTANDRASILQELYNFKLFFDKAGVTSPESAPQYWNKMSSAFVLLGAIKELRRKRMIHGAALRRLVTRIQLSEAVYSRLAEDGLVEITEKTHIALALALLNEEVRHPYEAACSDIKREIDLIDWSAVPSAVRLGVLQMRYDALTNAHTALQTYARSKMFVQFKFPDVTMPVTLRSLLIVTEVLIEHAIWSYVHTRSVNAKP